MTGELPEGYELVEDNPPPPLRGVLEPEIFSAGRIIIFLGWHEVKKADQTYRGVFVAGRNRPEDKRLIWAHRMLQRLLEGARPGDLVYLRYMGLHPHPTTPGFQEHVWQAALPKKVHPQAVIDFD